MTNIFEELKAEILAMELPELNNNEKEHAKLYLKEKMDYGFHLYHVIEHNPYNTLTGKNGMVTELYYDLRNKIRYVKRNGKDVAFSVRNVDFIFGTLGFEGYNVGYSSFYHMRNHAEKLTPLFTFLSTENNKGMYFRMFSLLSAMAGEHSNQFGRFLHRLMTEYSCLEILFKAGLIGDRFHISDIVNTKGTKPHEIVGVSKQMLKILKKVGLGSDYWRTASKIPIQDVNKIAFLLKLSEELDDEFGLEHGIDAAKDEIKNYDLNYYYSILNLCKTYPFLDYKRLFRYVHYEALATQGMENWDASRYLKDYLNMCVQMRLRRFDNYPKYLKTMHDVVSYNFKFKVDEIHRRKFTEMQEFFSQFNFKYKDFVITHPKKPEDIITEGNVLGHCVASYVKNVVAEATTILFLRKKGEEEEPYVTVEVKKGAIVQARGAYNRSVTEEEKEVLEKFAKKLDLISSYR